MQRQRTRKVLWGTWRCRENIFLQNETSVRFVRRMFKFLLQLYKKPWRDGDWDRGSRSRFRTCHKTSIKIEIYVIQTSPTSHFVEKCFLYNVKYLKNFASSLSLQLSIHFIKRLQNVIFSLGTCLGMDRHWTRSGSDWLRLADTGRDRTDTGQD